eukprot:364465-Chlamydomonas_euryale.AAC.3
MRRRQALSCMRVHAAAAGVELCCMEAAWRCMEAHAAAAGVELCCMDAHARRRQTLSCMDAHDALQIIPLA